MWTDDEPKPKPDYVIGSDLSRYSVADLKELAETLRSEIARVEEAERAKASSRAAADTIFKS